MEPVDQPKETYVERANREINAAKKVRKENPKNYRLILILVIAAGACWLVVKTDIFKLNKAEPTTTPNFVANRKAEAKEGNVSVVGIGTTNTRITSQNATVTNGIAAPSAQISNATVNNIQAAPGSAVSVGQSGGITANNVNIYSNVSPPPKVTYQFISKNVPKGTNFETVAKMSVQTERSIRQFAVAAIGQHVVWIKGEGLSGPTPMWYISGGQTVDGKKYVSFSNLDQGEVMITVRTSQPEELQLGYSTP